MFHQLLQLLLALAVVAIVFFIYPKLEAIAWQLTRENWGLPWHFILSNQGVKIGGFLLGWKFQLPQYQALGFAAFVVLVIGFGYEFYQKKKYGPDRANTVQDIAANMLGIFLALLL